MERKIHSRILMAALFATGLSGIVAEYMLATLATYFLGNSVLQWTLILSFMLFSMGLGSRISKYISKNLLTKFIILEFLLSLLVSLSTLVVYASLLFENTTITLTDSHGLVVYTYALLIGLLIGMEIPLVTRINDQYKELKVNISSVLEKDYYGSLFGGIFFAFIGLPFFGLTYTPFILGGINLFVAILVFVIFYGSLSKKIRVYLSGFGIITTIIILFAFANATEIVKLGEERRFVDKVIYSKETKYQHITITEYQDDHWLYLDNHTQLSSFDEYIYHEALVHPAFAISKVPQRILILGGGDGCTLREVLKYGTLELVTLVDLDPEMTNLGFSHPVLVELNDSSFHNPKVKTINADAFKYLESTKEYFDLIIIDFPDPRSVELNRLYTLEFYKLCLRRLMPHGSLITQASSPYITTAAFRSIEKTIHAAGFNVLPLHNHVYSFGEWGYILASKTISKENMKKILHASTFNNIETRWINNEAMQLMTSFAKDINTFDTIEVNSIHNQITYRYYDQGIRSSY